jgi:Rieske 2Fe-2S family protein
MDAQRMDDLADPSAALRARARRWLAQRRPGHTLPQPFYGDPDLHALDLALVFGRRWLFAGPECELADPGDFLTLEIGTTSVLVCRDRAGQVRAFFNTCRHRGSIVVDAARGRAPTFVCPYHRWGYDLTGRLVRAPNMGAGFDRAAHGLRPVHCAVVGGLVFICLADRPPDLAPFRAALEPRIAPHRLAEAKTVAEIVLDEQANWKLVWENSRECDHCAAGHPLLMRTLRHFNLMDPAGDPEIAAFWQRCEAAGLPSRTEAAPDFRAGRIPLLPGQQTISPDGSYVVARKLGDVAVEEIGSLRFSLYPGLFGHVHADYAVLIQTLPTGPRGTRVRCRWLVHRDAEEGRDFDRERLLAVWRATNDEDRIFCERNQRGVDSAGYRPGPYAQPGEAQVAAFVDWYCATLADGLGDRAAEDHTPLAQAGD